MCHVSSPSFSLSEPFGVDRAIQRDVSVVLDARIGSIGEGECIALPSILSILSPSSYAPGLTNTNLMFDMG